jgi:hypothetical protein
LSSGKTEFNYPMDVLDKPVIYDIPREPILEQLTVSNFTNLNFNNKLTKVYSKLINIHFFLSNNNELTNNQKLNYCTIERYFMKLYLKEMIKKM